MRLNDASWDHAGERRLDFYESGAIFSSLSLVCPAYSFCERRASSYSTSRK